MAGQRLADIFGRSCLFFNNLCLANRTNIFDSGGFGVSFGSFGAFFEKKGCPRIWGIMMIYMLLLILLISIGMWALPAFNRELAGASRGIAKIFSQA